MEIRVCSGRFPAAAVLLEDDLLRQVGQRALVDFGAIDGDGEVLFVHQEEGLARGGGLQLAAACGLDVQAAHALPGTIDEFDAHFLGTH